MNMGYSRASIEESVVQQKFDDIQATYLLLGRRTTDVRLAVISCLMFKAFRAVKSNENFVDKSLYKSGNAGFCKAVSKPLKHYASVCLW